MLFADNEKHRPPSLSDDIRHLDNIGKAGSDRLKKEQINTVEDFLTEHLKDPDRLKQVIFSTDFLKVQRILTH